MSNTLDRSTWQQARALHRSIVEPWVQPRLDRKSRQEKHPVDDFLFEYYPISPGKVLAWHPGFDIQLDVTQDDLELFSEKFYRAIDGVLALKSEHVGQQREAMSRTVEFLSLTRSRQPVIGCFGLHEWAMVLGQETVRHDAWKLRLPQSEIRQTIDDIGLRCTHFDAFRFFTDEARPLNPLQLSRADQVMQEQPGCLHANMDLYKIAFTHGPILGSDVVRDAFALARDIRTVDMQVAPYDLAQLGVTPIPVETTEGRAEFATRQREFSARADVLRQQIIATLERVLAHTLQEIQ